VLISLAYESALFERCIAILSRVAAAGDLNDRSNHAAELFGSLFSLYLSGTLASIEQRLRVTEPMLRSDDAKQRSLGLMAIKGLLKAAYFTSHHHFKFGARLRDFGYRPCTFSDLKHWFGQTLELSETLACSDLPVAADVRKAIAEQIRSLDWGGRVRRSRKGLPDHFSEGILA